MLRLDLIESRDENPEGLRKGIRIYAPMDVNSESFVRLLGARYGTLRFLAPFGRWSEHHHNRVAPFTNKGRPNLDTGPCEENASSYRISVVTAP